MLDYESLDFFGYSDDQRKLILLLKEAGKPESKLKLCLMAAPSFVVDFDFKNFVQTMKSLGFDKVTELTFGAKIVNENYYAFIKKHFSEYRKKTKKPDRGFQEKFISSVCPASVELIKNSFPQMKKFLLPFVSPMGAMARIVRKNFPKHKIVFLSPCSAKKFEASKLLNKKGKPLVECCVTFTEMKQLIAKEKPKINNRDLQKNGSGFDFFGNDFTKIYPLAGGLCGTLHYSDLLSKSEVVSCDGAKNFSDLFRNHSDKVFFDVLFCVHGCINGPGVASNSPAFLRKQKVFSYINHAKKEKIKGKQGLKKYSEGIDFGRTI